MSCCQRPPMASRWGRRRLWMSTPRWVCFETPSILPSSLPFSSCCHRCLAFTQQSFTTWGIFGPVGVTFTPPAYTPQSKRSGANYMESHREILICIYFPSVSGIHLAGGNWIMYNSLYLICCKHYLAVTSTIGANNNIAFESPVASLMQSRQRARCFFLYHYEIPQYLNSDSSTDKEMLDHPTTSFL